MAVTHAGVPRGGNEAVSKLEDLELSLLSQTHEGAGTQVGHAVEVTGEELGDLGLASDDVLAQLSGSLDPSGLLLEGSGVEDEGGEAGSCSCRSRSWRSPCRWRAG